MSFLVEAESACPHCKHPNEVEVWSSINVQEDPELLDLLLGGELNMAECEACKEIFYAEHFLLYHDPRRELLAFVYPRDASLEKERFIEKTKTDFAQTQTDASAKQKIAYDPVTMFGLDELVRLVEHEEEVDIQGEIVATLAQEQGLGVRRLRPAEARRQHLPPIVPVDETPGVLAGEAVCRALAKITSINDRLSIYNELYRRLLANPSLEVAVH